MQREMALLGQANPPIKDVPSAEIVLCSTEQAAYRMCINNAVPRRLHSDIAFLLNMKEATFSRIINADYHKNKRHAGRVFQIQLQAICNNRVIDRWADLYVQGMLNCQRTVADRQSEIAAKMAELQAETEKLERFVG